MKSNESSNIIRFPGGATAAGVLQLRVELLLMPLPVWRRLLIPGIYSFWDLHVAVQDVMGWEDRHLHQFTLDDPVTGSRMRLGIPDDSGFYGVNEVMPGWEHKVARYMRVESLPVLYTYDFGDEWQHEIVLEASLPATGDQLLPRCLAGEGSCPPEDCGGPPGYSALLESGLSEEFDPAAVTFDNPRDRWDRAFRHD